MLSLVHLDFFLPFTMLSPIPFWSPEAHSPLILDLLHFGSFYPRRQLFFQGSLHAKALYQCSNAQGLGELVTFQTVKVQEVSPLMATNKTISGSNKCQHSIL